MRIFVGVRLMFEVDLAVEISLANPRPVAAVRLRDGGTAPETSITCGLLTVEVKQQSRESFEMEGPELFPVYGRARSRRSVGKQIEDGVIGVKDFLKRYTDEMPFVHGLGWLTDMPENELRAAPAYIVGREATWSDMLQAAATRQRILFADPAPSYHRAIETFGNILAKKRRIPPRDRAAVDRLTNATIANGRFEEVKNALGSRQVRLAGRAGSGKSTALALLAEYVARVRQERMLVLTYNHALCHEIERLIRSVVNDDALVDRHVRVATLVDFLAHACAELGADIARVDGHIDYRSSTLRFARSWSPSRPTSAAAKRRSSRSSSPIATPSTTSASTRRRIASTANATCSGYSMNPNRWCSPTASTSSCAGKRRATGRRASRARLASTSTSLRASACRATSPSSRRRWRARWEWKVGGSRHIRELSGGRIVILPRPYDREFFDEVLTSLKAAKLHPRDLLVCVPPSEIVSDGPKRDSKVAQALRSWGYRVWNGCDEEVRRTEVPDDDEIRVVLYDSMRGLEGWSTVLVALDEFYTHRVAHPNLRPNDRCTPEAVAKRWVLMALTRAAQTLAITISDPSSEVADWLRRSGGELPDDVVEWRT